MSNDSHKTPRPFFNRRGFLQSMGAAALTALVGCEDEQEAAEAQAPKEAGAAKAGAVKAKAEPLKEVRSFKEGNRLRFSMTDLAHFADRSSEGLLAIQLGEIAARKYTNGGWRAGWSTVPRKDGDESYFEADTKTSRVFFKHSKNGYDRLMIRMKAVKSANTVTLYVNDEAIKTVDIDGEWKNYTIDIPAKARTEGENQLMFRWKYDTTKDGRRQAAHVAAVWALPKGAKAEDAPKGSRLQTLSFEDVAQDALVAATPQTYTFRVQLPKNDPKLAITWGARKPGATFKVTAVNDGDKELHTLLEESVDAESAGAWQESVVDLGMVAGSVAEIDLTVSGDFGDGQLAAWGEPGVYTPEVNDGAGTPKKADGHAKHVLVYLIDTLRYDKFDFYNRKTSAKTPNISKFARESVIFDAAYDNENWTKPSTASILTGLYPETHKAKEDDSKLPSGAWMISEHFKKAGFTTGSFLANGYVSDAFGFKQGWDFYTNYIREKKNTNADRVVEDALEWIGENKDKGRLFTYVHTIDPHVPYSPPTKYREMYWNRDYNGPIKPQATGQQLADIKTDKLKLNNTDKKYLEALYDGETTFNDHAFGELVAGLKKMGLYDETAIVIIADHGEEFWDHGSVGHGHSLHEELVHSPQLVRFPNKAPAGRRVPHVVSMVDLAPSLCDLAGVDGHDDFEGRSWVDTLDGTGDPHPRIAVSDFLYRKKSIRAGRYKWITIGRYGELYDVVRDRGEEKNLLKKHPIARAFVRSQFGVFSGAADKAKWWVDKNVDKARPELKADKAEMDEDTQNMLEELGYVEGAKGDLDAAADKKKMEEEDN